MSKNGAFHPTVDNQQGVSLLETMISFTIFMMLASLFPVMFSYWIHSTPKINEFSYEENVLFLAQLEHEFRRSETYWTNEAETRLYFDRPEDHYIVHFEKYQDKVRRRVQGLGHEIFLQRITGFHVYDREYGVDVVVIAGGRTFRKALIHPASLAKILYKKELEM